MPVRGKLIEICMAPSHLFDLSAIDLTAVQFDIAQIESFNPHRGHMRLLDGIINLSENKEEAVAFKDIREDAFWVPGHIPGRPLFPGVLMIEAAAQLASFMVHQQLKVKSFLGFIGADAIKFRGQVVPGDRMIILGKQVELRPRRFICATQAIVNGSLVYEGTITGMAI